MMTQVREIVAGWMDDEEGASLVEYVLLVALIAAVCMVAIGKLGSAANTKFGNVAGQIGQ